MADGMEPVRLLLERVLTGTKTHRDGRAREGRGSGGREGGDTVTPF